MKARCDGYDKDSNDTMTCNTALKVSKNDQIKFVMSSSGPSSHTAEVYTYVEGFLAVQLNQ